ncbi:drug/metabolite exporter YedA, partial [Pseudomonas frederiksbergensis]|nr:drug/metabolite exporter YedA [Pseudomonas frederiksbergensis]
AMAVIIGAVVLIGVPQWRRPAVEKAKPVGDMEGELCK